jgi:threonyl-tRNA synthetase
MIDLIFPDGSKRQYDDGVTGKAVAASIAPSLAKRAALIKLEGELYDVDRPLPGGGHFEILTRDARESLETLRHDASHIMAEAVQELFPGTQVTIGPSIEDGFYYDFARAEPFSLDDLAAIEARMKEIVDRDEAITREVWKRDEAIAHFKSIGEAYKAEIIEGIPAGEDVSVYRQGTWKDLCRGPHFPSTKFVGKAFKLTKLAGAYWRGDHRKIGRAMDLFHLQEEAKGMIFWHPKGWTLYRTVEAYMRRRLDADGYVEVKAPQIMDRVLWEKSGHWEKFGKNMFTCETEEGEVLAVKPMNCPGHVQIFNHGQKSYRDLPLRMAEFGACHRYEPSGALHGIFRVRAFTQDDAHIFCREDQIEAESTKFIRLLEGVYRDCGLELHAVKLALRPELRFGTDEVWDVAEAKLERAARNAGIAEIELLPGEGAFYGPKLEFHLRDAIGRTWQCGTLQLDYVLPERLDAEYVAEDGSKQRPVMLHRAICGSMERFLGVMIESYAGAFPLWLAPVQVTVATITSDADEFALQAAAALRARGLRVETDLRNEKINLKVREHSLAKVPVIAVVGRREAELGQVALRRLGSDGQEILDLTAAVNTLALQASPPDVALSAGGAESPPLAGR